MTNIAEILKNCPKGTPLYSPMFGKVLLVRVNPEDFDESITVWWGAARIEDPESDFEVTFRSDGLYCRNDGECMLFPSKENRDWSTFNTELPQDESPFKVKQKITISGRNWNDIIRLSCFRELQHNAAWTLRVSATYVDGVPASADDDWYGVLCYVGDTLIEYETGGWEVKHAHKAQ